MLSVIVPVFNKEKYISRCVDTIMSQSYKSIEIILVDDGSTDESGSICDRLVELDNRIHVIHKQNEGLIMARRTGVKNAKGEYLTFVDADDWIESNMYYDLMENITQSNADFVTSGMIYEGSFSDVQTDGYDEGEYVCCSKEMLGDILWNFKQGKCGIMPSLCNKVFRRDFLLNSLSDVDKRITIGEDRAILYSAISNNTRFVVRHHAYYHYRTAPDSMCHDINVSNIERAILLWDYLYRFWDTRGVLGSIRYSFERNFREVLDAVENDCFGINSLNYVFPFGSIQPKCNLIIYGLGVVGKSYCKYVQATGYANIAAVADNNIVMDTFGTIPVVKPEAIVQYDFDYVLVANLRESVAKSIKETLIQMGIREEKIIWLKPKVV